MSFLRLDTSRLSLARSHGIDIELEYALPEGWTVEFREDDYLVECIDSSAIHQEIWKLVGFLKFDFFMQLRKIDNYNGFKTCYEFITLRTEWTGFRIYFVSG